MVSTLLYIRFKLITRGIASKGMDFGLIKFNW